VTTKHNMSVLIVCALLPSLMGAVGEQERRPGEGIYLRQARWSSRVRTSLPRDYLSEHRHGAVRSTDTSCCSAVACRGSVNARASGSQWILLKQLITVRDSRLYSTYGPRLRRVRPLTNSNTRSILASGESQGVAQHRGRVGPLSHFLVSMNTVAHCLDKAE
jgi:hypothetical protein